MKRRVADLERIRGILFVEHDGDPPRGQFDSIRVTTHDLERLSGEEGEAWVFPDGSRGVMIEQEVTPEMLAAQERLRKFRVAWGLEVSEVDVHGSSA